MMHEVDIGKQQASAQTCIHRRSTGVVKKERGKANRGWRRTIYSSQALRKMVKYNDGN
jgi:hypothetical protein